MRALLQDEPGRTSAPIRCCSLRWCERSTFFGEAAAKVSALVKSSSPELPWQQIVAIRNRLVHAYFDIDREILWKTATDEIPALVPHLRKLIQE